SATASSTPDVVAGRSGLMDIASLGWLAAASDARTCDALDFLLANISAAEELTDQPVQRMSHSIIERLRADEPILPSLFAHTRWVGFQLDSALAPERNDRSFGPALVLQRNSLVAQRPPPLERAPGLGLRVANLVGLAPPSAEL